MTCRKAVSAVVRLVAGSLSLSLAACSSIGPTTVPQDRIDYATSIGNSWKDQTLLNIVKLRYGDLPIFLEITQVIAGYQVQTTIGASFSGREFQRRDDRSLCDGRYGARRPVPIRTGPRSSTRRSRAWIS